jgi:phosphatidylglycerol:prolipoprotein diacylglycerol transferase
VVFHLGPLQIHTYGIGLALTFWFALWYMRRRFQAAGLPWEWLNRAFLWVVGAAIVGARLVHVVANLSYYRSNPGDILAVWHGGLSSFGGLLLGVPTAIWFQRRFCPQITTMASLDLAAPVLIASWALGRLLGPQVMVNGGGHPTTAWYGLSYAGQVGKRIPVPLFQSIECWVIWLLLLLIEARTRRKPTGVILAAFAGLWGMARFSDEFFWLATPRLWDAVEGTGLALAAGGWAAVAWLLLRRRRSDLVPGAPVGGPAPDDAAGERLTVPRAEPALAASGHQVTGMGAAPPDELGEGGADAPRQSPDLGPLEGSGRASGVEPGPPQGLVDQQVAEAGQASLVHEPGLERGAGPVEDGGQLGGPDRGGVGTEAVLGRVEAHPTQAAGVGDLELASAGEPEDQPLPGGVGTAGGVDELIDAGDTVEEQATGHAEAKAEGRPGGVEQ